MLKEAIEKLLDLSHATTIDVDGQTYTTRPVYPCKPPQMAAIGVHTLAGLVDLIDAKFDGTEFSANSIICVHTPWHVTVEDRVSDVWGQRKTIIDVTMQDVGAGFPFGRWMDPDEFVIGLQSVFAPTPDRDTVLMVASNLTSEVVQISEDDGMTQRATIRKGVALKSEVQVKPRVRLSPYRTFREIEQPASDFVFRLKSKAGETPQCALFEADGGRWKLAAMLAIKGWLKAQQSLCIVPVVA